MNNLQTFSNSEFGALEVLEIDGKPYFPATACAKMLGYSNPRDAIKRHCKADGVVKHDGVSSTVNQYGKESEQIVQTNFISEGNLYRLIVHSKLPAAERFERWVFDEVLPAIRKQGMYTPNLNETLTQIINATAAIAEVVKQIAPMIQQVSRASDIVEDKPSEVGMVRKKSKPTLCAIERLSPDIRSEVDRLLISEGCTYREVALFLASCGIKLSQMAVCNYYHKCISNIQPGGEET